jgi:hypothetical protein
MLVDPPATVFLRGGRLLLRWPRVPEVSLRLRAAPSWVERDLRTLTARRFAGRPEATEAAKKADDLNTQGDELAASARKETDLVKKYPSEGYRRRALDLVDRLARQFEGTEYAAEASRLRQELTGGETPPPDNVTKPPDDGTKPPDREPIESARKLLEWAEQALSNEEFLKAEIFSRNVIDRWPGTPEEIKAGELLGRATAGARATRERDDWIRDTLARARNLVKNRQPEKAIPLFEDVLKKHPGSPLVKGVAEELEALR